MAQIKERILNTTILMGSKLLRPLVSFIFIKIVIDDLGVEGLGVYTTIFSLGMIFELISSFAIKSLLIKEIAQEPSQSKKIFVHGLALVVPIALLCVLVINAYVNFFGNKVIVISGILMFSGSLLATAVNDCAEGVLIGNEKTRIIGIVGIAENIIRVVLSIIFIKHGYGFTTVFLIYAILRWCVTIFYTWNLRKYWSDWKFKLERSYYLYLFKKSRVFALSAIFVTVYWKADIIMLSEIKDSIAVGIYDGAYRFFSIITVAIGSLVISLLPVISEKIKNDIGEFAIMCKKMVKYFLCLALPGAASLIILSKFIINLLSKNLRDSVGVLHILALTVISYGVAEIIAHIFIASGNKKTDTMVNGIGMVANIILNLFLIPRYSYMGAAAATFISINLYLGLQLFFIKRKLDVFDKIVNLNSILKFGLCAASLGIFLALGAYFNRYYYAIPGLFLYILGLWKLRIITAEDKVIVVSIFQTLRNRK